MQCKDNGKYLQFQRDPKHNLYYKVSAKLNWTNTVINIVYNDDVEYDKIDDLNTDLLHLRNGLGDNINDANNKHQYIEEGGIFDEDEGQRNHFGNTNNILLVNNIPLGQNGYFGGVDNIDNDNNKNNNIHNESQNHDRNHGNQISDNDTTGNASNDDDDCYDGIPEGNLQYDHDPPEGGDHNPEYEEHEDDNIDEPGDDGQDADDIEQVEEDDGAGRRRRSMHHSLSGANKKDALDGDYWNRLTSLICPVVGAMVVAKQTGVRMMKEYFKIETSKSTPQYGFRKGLQLFGDEGYQAAKIELKTNLLGRGCIDMLPRKDLTWDIRKRALGYLMFLKRKQSGKNERKEEVVPMVILNEIKLPRKNQARLLYRCTRLWAPVLWMHWMTEKS